MKANWMRTLMGMAAILVMSAGLAVAGPKKALGNGPAVKAIDMLSRAAAKVELSDEQKGTLKTIMADAVAQAQAIVDEARAAGDKPDRKAMQAKVAELVKATRAKIDDVLTDDQKTAFANALAEEREKAKSERKSKADKPADKPAQ